MAVQDAELKLKVSLDLAFFRQQLSGLGQAAAGYNVPVSIKFDRKRIADEYRLLNRYISGKEFKVLVSSNLKTEIDNANKLALAIARAQQIAQGAKGSFPIGVEALGLKRREGQPSVNEIKKLYEALAVAGVEGFERATKKTRPEMVAKIGALGKDTIAGLLNGLQSEDSRLKMAAKSLGQDLINSLKNVLGIASPSREFKKIGEDSGEGLEQGLKAGFTEATRMSIQEMRNLYRALQGEAQSGAARLKATIIASMAGIVQLPGSGQQRGRLLQTGAGVNAAMTGAAVGNIQSRRASAKNAASAAPSFLSALPLMFGMSERELTTRLSGLYGQQYRAPAMGGRSPIRPGYIENLLSSLASARGALGTGGGITGQLFSGGARNPGVQPSGYIGRSALSAGYVNYPPGMPPAYPAGFAGVTAGRFRMGTGSLGQFPLSGPLQRGIKAGEGSFVPSEEITQARKQLRSFGNTLGGAKSTIQTVFRKIAGDFSIPEPRTEAQISRAITTRWATLGGSLGRGFVEPSGGIGFYKGGFPTSGMAVSSPPLGKINAQTSMFGPNGPAGPGNRPPGGGGGNPPPPPSGGGGISGFGRALGSINIPGTGVVREIGDEFAMATKQVLLFGTTYKALAFITSFPAQVGQAVGALQSFNNTLKAISPSAAEAKASNQFILDIVDRYNVPLQSARDGFTKLYASMAPAGFKGEEIRALFTGVSQAAATFGMSADKVDRVNYAFAQMASKGQVMSEELKGQLGDVLPGAMGIFAKAAGFEGPKAIEQFSEALEDGAYKGDAMRSLLKNVTKELQREFGPGAEGAARTFQGVINRMQNSTKLLYEAFEPVAVGFLNAVVVPLTSGIKTITDGFNAFFTGTQAKTVGGMAFAQELERLRPTFEGLQANITALIPSLQLFGSVLLNAAKFLATVAGNPITGFLLQLYANVLLVNTAFKLLGGQILIGLVTSINAAIVRMVAFGYAINAVGIQATGARTALAGTQLQMLLLQRSAAGLVGPLTLSNLAMAALAGKAALVVGGLVLLGKGVYDTNETFRNFVKNIGGVVATDFRNSVEGMTEDAKDSAKNIESSYKDLITKLSPIGQGVKQLFEDVFKSTFDSAAENATKATNVFSQFFDSLSSNATEGFNGLSAVINNWWANLPAPIRKIFEGNALSTLVGAGKYAAGAANRASAPNAQATGMFGRYIPGSAQTKIPATSKGGKDGGGDGSGTGGGAVGGGTKPKKERESKIPELMLRLEKTKELAAIELQLTNAMLMNNTAQVSSLELAKQLIEFKYESKEVELQGLTAAEEAIAKREIALRAEQAILSSQLQLQIDLKKERDEVQQGFSKILDGYKEESGYQQQYLNLINQGILPSVAKARIEVEKSFKQEEKRLDTLIELTKTNIVSTEAIIEQLKLQTNLTAEGKKQLEDAEKRLAVLKEELKLRQGIKDSVPEAKKDAQKEAEKGLKPKTPREYLGEGLEAAQDRLKELTNIGYQVVSAANAIGDAFGEAFKGLITGSMTAREALAGFFQSIADYFADMVAQMIAEWLKAQLIQGFLNIFGAAIPGAGPAAAASPATPASNFVFAANGAVWAGGFQAFADGGIVSGPTLGLVGEGRYNEAIIPLPDGKSVPVDLGDTMGGTGGEISTNIVINVNNGQMQSEGGGNASSLGRKMEGAVKQVIVNELRPGGVLAGRR
jgi:tape measure domain-containing protein